MRLTLRTLLSYLDDMLEPAQARVIGAKVAESDQARELAERIKQVTRRRRLTTPPQSGPGGMDANTIAEYLDNEVTPEKSAEVEQICLASDVHLAEVAACHQILTLVLGEPALVPPTAKQRMYTLVKGPESIPFRKPPKPVSAEDQDLSSELEPDQDDTLRLGVPAVSKGGMDQRNLTLLIGAGVVAALLLVLAVWQFMKPPPVPAPPPDNKELTQAEKDRLKKEADEKAARDVKDRDEKAAKDKAEREAKEKAEREAKEKEQNPEKKLPITIIPVVPEKAPPRIEYEPASTKQDAIGKFLAPTPRKAKDPLDKQADGVAVLLQKSPKKDWTRVTAKTGVFAAQPLMSLPGSKSVIALDTGIELTLWGNLPELTLDGSVLESRVTAHVAPAPFDADLLLERGRVVIRNRKAGGADAQVRIRFLDPMPPKAKDAKEKDIKKAGEANDYKGREEYLDITLVGADAAVALDRLGANDPEEPFEENQDRSARLGPSALVRIFALEQTARIHYGPYFESMNERGKTMLEWHSRNAQLRTPEKVQMPPGLQFVPELKDKGSILARDKAIQAHLGLAKLVETQEPGAALDEFMKDVPARAQKEMIGGKLFSVETAAQWQHSIRCKSAVDLIDKIYFEFAAPDTPIHFRYRNMLALQLWITWGRDNDYDLMQTIEKAHTSKTVPGKIMKLFHMTSKEDGQKAAHLEYLIDGLNNDVLPIRMLSHWNLINIAPEGAKYPYDPVMPPQIRRQAMEAWRSLVLTPPAKKDKTP